MATEVGDTVTEQTGPGSDFLATVCQLWEAATALASDRRGKSGVRPQSGWSCRPPEAH